MRRYFLFVVAILLLGTVAGKGLAQAAPETQDVVYLKDGTVLRGTILEYVPSEALRIQIEGGSVFVIETERIEKVVREPRVRPEPARPAPQAPAAVEIPEKKSVVGALLLSALYPGLGQLYNGDTGKGVAHIGVATFSLLMVLSALSDNYGAYDPDGDDGIGGIFLLIGIANNIWSLVDAPLSAHRKNQERERLLRERQATAWRLRVYPIERGGAVMAARTW